ncbi:MAG: hypothetical protein JWO46_2817 [Nocardioidaceae bacterium]|nr:hypothetical protein [Nocardioidaceae bacterium]
MSEQPGRYQRAPSGLVASMLVLLLAIAGFVVFRAVFRGDQDVPVPTVDYSLVLRQAREAGIVAAPAPDPMPAKWRATSVRYSAQSRTWHLGILTASDAYVGIEESPADRQVLVDRSLGKGAAQGAPVTLDGVQWASWSQGPAYALTRDAGSGIVLVGGPAGKTAVTELAGHLSLGSG